MSEDSNLPTPPPSPEERPVQPETGSPSGGLDGDSWLLDVGPEPGTEYEEHESVPALPLDWNEGAPAAEWEQGTEAAEAPSAFAEGVEVFEEAAVYGEVPEGYEDFGDGGETSFIEPPPRSRPVIEAILPGSLAMLLSFAGIAVWSFLRTPTSFNENVELARSEHEIHFTPDDEVELAKPLQLPSSGPSDDRVAGWMEIGQTASDLSEPDELGYASSTADEVASYASVSTGPEPTVVTAVEPMEMVPQEDETVPEPDSTALTVLEALGAAEPVVTEPQATEPQAIEPQAIEHQAIEPTPATTAAAEVTGDTPAAMEPEALVAEAPAAVMVEEQKAPVAIEPEPVAAEISMEEPAEELVAETTEEIPAGGMLQELLGDLTGWKVVAVEVVGEPDAGATLDPLVTAEPRPYQGPGCVAAPLERLSDGPFEAVAAADEPEADGAGALATEDGAELDSGAYAPSWLMALVAPASPVADALAEEAPTVAQLSLPEPEVNAVIEEPAVSPEPFDWTSRSWAPEVAMSEVGLPEVDEPYEPRVVEIEVFGAVEEEVAVAAESTMDEVVLQEESLEAEVPPMEAPAAEAVGVAALGWPSDWPSPWEPEPAAPERTLEIVEAPVPAEMAEATEPWIDASPGDEVAEAEIPGVEGAPSDPADVVAPVALTEPIVEVATTPEAPTMFEDPVAAVEVEESLPVEPALEEIASAEPNLDAPVLEEPRALEPTDEAPAIEVAAVDTLPEPHVATDETSLEAPSLTAIGWPADWPMTWDAEPIQVSEPPAVAAVEAPEESLWEADAAEPIHAPAPEAEALALDTEPQSEPTEPAAVLEPVGESAAMVAEMEPAAPLAAEAEPLEVIEPAPTAELVAAADEAPATTDDGDFESLSGHGEDAFEVDAPPTESHAELATEILEPATEVAVAESDEAIESAPLTELDGDVAEAAPSEDVEEEAAVAMVGPALPEIAPVLLPPSPDLVSDLHAELSMDDSAMTQETGVPGFEVAASIPAAEEGGVEAEFESISSAGTIPQKEVAVEVVGSLTEEAPARRRRQLLERVEDERYWRFKSVPSRKFNDDEMVFTPNVGNVRVVLKGGEAFDGRLHSVGQGKIMLDTKMGRMAVDARRADRVDRITDDRSVLRGPATTTSTAGLKRVRVKTDGGVFYGHLVSRAGKRVTLLMDEGFRITLESDDVTEAADRRGGRLRRVDQR